ncbi:uncharacterized protein [Diadema setosum]|uniref:uncharacterized protein n=1 Tax=Diadema setosum TaxID=31175 RepID=UPI003B3BCB3E
MEVQLDVQSVKWYKLIEDGLKELLIEADYISNHSTRFQSGLKLVNKTFLEIENVGPVHNGTYTCIVQHGNSAQQTEITVNVVVEKESWHHSLWKVIRPSPSGFILLGGLGIFFFVCLFKKWLKGCHDRQDLVQQSHELSETPRHGT